MKLLQQILEAKTTPIEKEIANFMSSLQLTKVGNVNVKRIQWFWANNEEAVDTPAEADQGSYFETMYQITLANKDVLQLGMVVPRVDLKKTYMMSVALFRGEEYAHKFMQVYSPLVISKAVKQLPGVYKELINKLGDLVFRDTLRQQMNRVRGAKLLNSLHDKTVVKGNEYEKAVDLLINQLSRVKNDLKENKDNFTADIKERLRNIGEIIQSLVDESEDFEDGI
jgi:hypothetical protein